MERQFLALLPVLDMVLGAVARRHRLPASDAEELASIVRLHLIEDDYEALRQFQGRSSWRAYLSVIVARQFLDFRAARWGKWRPSAAARRLGPLAIRLETLVSRDGLSFEQACEHLRTGEAHRVPIEDMRAWLASFPRRQQRRRCDDARLQAMADDEGESDPHVKRLDSERTVAALDAAMKQLSPDESQLIAWRFRDSHSVAEIARARELDQSLLYRRIWQILTRLRIELAANGISGRDVIAWPERQAATSRSLATYPALRGPDAADQHRSVKSGPQEDPGAPVPGERCAHARPSRQPPLMRSGRRAARTMGRTRI